MKNKLLIVLLLAMFIGTLIFASDYFNSEQKKTSGNVEIRDTSRNIETKYVTEISDASFQEEVLNSDQKVLIDFYATWCEPCKMLSPIIDEVAKENQEIKFVRVDVDKNQDLSLEYGIQYMPTLVLIEGGEEVNRSIGLIDKDTLLDFLGGNK